MVSDFLSNPWESFGMVIGWAVGLFVLALLCGGVYAVLSLALRRQERARLFLDLLETGMKQGRSPEQTIVSLANAGDRSLDVWFYLLAGYIEHGYRLDQALEKVRCFLPHRVRTLLQAGYELGDLRKVLPVCRKALQDGATNTLASQNSLGVVLFSLPFGPIIVGWMFVMVLPKIKAIAVDMNGPGAFPWFGLFKVSEILAVISVAAWLAFVFSMVIQNGGPRFVAWLQHVLWSFVQRVELRLPWGYKRLQRDFSALLGLLLDAGMPEPKAIQIAAEGTGNWFFQQRAKAVVNEMRQGARLTEAVQSLDKDGEFKWRLENAAAGPAGFASALAGWQESLDAKAFAQQQAVSQLVTTALVFLNGAIVALIAIGMFQMFVVIIQGAGS